MTTVQTHADRERDILQMWESSSIMQKQEEMTRGRQEFRLFDGPPFANGRIHQGHILTSTVKDTLARFAILQGLRCHQVWHWDTHGLPVEQEVNGNLMQAGIDPRSLTLEEYLRYCRESVGSACESWKSSIKKLGRWVDFDEARSTLDVPYMSTVWSVFAELHEKGMIYKSQKVLAYSPGCQTSLSNLEANMNYKVTSDPAAYVAFDLCSKENLSLLVFTTTPWTLPFNMAIAVNTSLPYVIVELDQRCYVVAEFCVESLEDLLGADLKTSPFDISSLLGQTYRDLFDCQQEAPKIVLQGDFVVHNVGTGLVHCAPNFGEEDYVVCKRHGIELCDSFSFIDEKGVLIGGCPAHLRGKFFKDADKDILEDLKRHGHLLHTHTIEHSYPFCYRSDQPLLYRAMDSWFVKVASISCDLKQFNDTVGWHPMHVGDKRFGNWVKNAQDWAVSRTRSWGTPLPVWISADGQEILYIGSLEHLERECGYKVDDLHRDTIDKIKIPSTQGKGFLTRIPDVFDCWFESGCLPFTVGNQQADFVAEGIDQCRGWFFTLLVLHGALRRKAPYKNVVCTGLVLSTDGKKMSKRDKNYTDPEQLLDQYGADPLRLYLLESPASRGDTLTFDPTNLKSVTSSTLLPLYNATIYLTQNWQRFVDNMGSADDIWAFRVPYTWLDRVMVADADEARFQIAQCLSRYDVASAARALRTFVERLTNIHVRLGRPRLNGSSGIRYAKSALFSLNYALWSFCKTIAPMIPFSADIIYQMMKPLQQKSLASVHHETVPSVSSCENQSNVLTALPKVMAIIELCRKVRQSHKLPVKLPLGTLTLEDDAAQTLSPDIINCVQMESNVDHIEIVPTGTLSTLTYSLNYSRAAARLGSLSRQIDSALRLEKQMPDLSGKYSVGNVELDEQDIMVKRKLKPGVGSAIIDSHTDTVIALDTRVTQQQLDRWVEREAIHLLQALRKKAQLSPSQHAFGAFEDYQCESSQTPVTLCEWGLRPQGAVYMNMTVCSGTEAEIDLHACLWTID